eukprot:GHVN01044451.1.p4 GENE.GHVN01044451.1~~GHVN01044451.1.p4  ORF type:complete len:739 (+),score=110.14 GHVN01044451.1:1662-3878(+)
MIRKEQNIPETQRSHCVLIFEGGRSKSECFMLALDISLGVLNYERKANEPVSLVQFLSVYPASDVLVLVESPNNTETQALITRMHPEVKSVSVSRREAKRIKKEKYFGMFEKEVFSSDEVDAVCFLLHYLSEQGSIGQSHCFVARECEDSDTVHVDRWTERSLELLFNNETNGMENTLFSAIDFTKTTSGKKRLRRALVAPPKHLETILMRQSTALFLKENAEHRLGLCSVFKGTRDIDGFISRLRRIQTADSPEKKIKEIVSAREIIDGALELKMLLRNAKDALLFKACEAIALHRLERLAKRIDESFERALLERDTKTKHCFLVRAEADSVVAMARSVYNKIVEDIVEHRAQIESEHRIEAKAVLRGKAFFFVSKQTFFNNIKKERLFLNVARKQGRVYFTTMELMKKNARLAQAEAEIHLASSEVVQRVFSLVSEELALFHGLSDVIGLVDMLHSFCEYSRHGSTTTPRFSKGVVVLKEAVCPVLGEDAAPNSYFLYEGNRLQLVTGRNMSGKTVYLKQIAQLCLLGYIGMDIPCKEAVLCLFDRIFVRSGADDDMLGNASSFFVEMKEMGFILSRADKKSLVLIDELGRGTGTADAMALSVAACELLLSKKCFVLFATHSQETVSILFRYPGVCRVELSGSYLGEGGEEEYGIEAAQAVGFPEEIVTQAAAIAGQLRSRPGPDLQPHSKIKRRYEQTMLMKKVLSEAALDDSAICGVLNQIGASSFSNEATQRF